MREGIVRCEDCLGQMVWCTSCLLENHQRLPFHRVQRWNGSCFMKSSLLAEGYVLHIGHGGKPCGSMNGERNLWENVTEDSDGWEDAEENSPASILTITDTNGVFKHRVAWCQCPGAPGALLQLFRDQMFPVTHHTPRSAFTFNVLDHFYIDSMECKTSANSFFHKLRRLTNSAFPGRVPVRQL